MSIPDNVAAASELAADHLDEIRKLFRPGAKLTLLVRRPHRPECRGQRTYPVGRPGRVAMSGRLPKHIRTLLRRARIVCSAVGCTCSYERNSSGHGKLIIEGRGQRRLKQVACTPTNADDSIRLALQDVRRILREICAVRAPLPSRPELRA